MYADLSPLLPVLLLLLLLPSFLPETPLLIHLLRLLSFITRYYPLFVPCCPFVVLPLPAVLTSCLYFWSVLAWSVLAAQLVLSLPDLPPEKLKPSRSPMSLYLRAITVAVAGKEKRQTKS